jgi:hypothetical protein
MKGQVITKLQQLQLKGIRFIQKLHGGIPLFSNSPAIGIGTQSQREQIVFSLS